MPISYAYLQTHLFPAPTSYAHHPCQRQRGVDLALARAHRCAHCVQRENGVDLPRVHTVCKTKKRSVCREKGIDLARCAHRWAARTLLAD
eukprot:2424413-Rhodomonas_salina.1